MPRSIWKGAISFGLVNIPVELQMAVHEKSIRFHMMSKDGSCRLRRKLYCPETGQEFDFNETARGLEIAKGEYVLLDESEIRRLRPERGQAIEISQFVDLEELDPLYFDRAYFVVPTEASVRPYKLLHEAMRKSGKIALARFVMRERQYLCALRVLDDGLVLHTLGYADEVESIDKVLPAAVEGAKPNPKELGIAVQLIESMSRPLDLSEFHDEYREKLEAFVEQRRQGHTVRIASEEEETPPARTVDLIDALRRSLELSGPPATGAPGKRRRPKAPVLRPHIVHNGRTRKPAEAEA
jgi:DNA end-binding protein Ku